MLPNDSDKPAFSRTVRALLAQFSLGDERDPLYVYLSLAAITLIGFSLRVIDLNQSIAYDEAYTFIHFASRAFKHILADYSAPNNHIFHTILVGISYRLFGGEPWALRLPAFLAGLLMIPATYVAARRFFSSSQSLAAAGMIAVTTSFINYSVNARGYTLLFLFAILLANFAGILVQRQGRVVLIAYIFTAALGFYTIPIFLYPMAGISLWVVSTYVVGREPWPEKFRRITVFLGACLIAGLLTILLYSPVIVFGSGFSSLVGNEIVKPLTWSTFLENLDPRMIKAWNKWTLGVSPVFENLFQGGFLLSLLFYWKVSNQKLPMQIFLPLGAAILVVLQRVTPLARIWLYLEVFYLMFAAAGLVWPLEWLVGRVANSELSRKIISGTVLLVFVAALAGKLIDRHQNPVYQDLDLLPESYAAEYLAAHLTPQDTIVANGPVDIQTAYYLSLHGIPFERFYQRDHPVKIQNALIMVRTNSKFKTPQSVVEFFKLDQTLDISQARMVYEYASVQIYSIPTK